VALVAILGFFSGWMAGKIHGTETEIDQGGMMEISVVIPLYNKEKYIYRTLASIMAQSLSPAEIVVVDDGSTDASVSEVLKFDDNRIRLIHQQNSGEGAARNRGVAGSKYDLVAFLDADDEWKPDFLLRIQKLCDTFPNCGAYATGYEVNEPDGSISYPVLKSIPPDPWMGIIPNLFVMLQNGAPFSPSSVAIPKKVYRDLKGFPEGVSQGADKMMWVRLGLNYPIAFSPSRQVVYHGDAVDRASSAYQQEPATANLIDEMLRKEEIPLALLDDVKDYNAYLKIQKAMHRVKAGQGRSARELLGSIMQNRKYRRQLAWWYFWSMVPYSLLRLVLRVRSRE
jgi:glycosyltransferase involved in cell wall biosynthesis